MGSFTEKITFQNPTTSPTDAQTPTIPRAVLFPPRDVTSSISRFQRRHRPITSAFAPARIVTIRPCPTCTTITYQYYLLGKVYSPRTKPTQRATSIEHHRSTTQVHRYPLLRSSHALTVGPMNNVVALSLLLWTRDDLWEGQQAYSR